MESKIEDFIRSIEDRDRSAKKAFARAHYESLKDVHGAIHSAIDDFAERKTGRLQESIREETRSSGSGRDAGYHWVGTVEPMAYYARILETGLPVIVPKRARALTVPLTAAARALPARHWGRRLRSVDGYLVDAQGRRHFQFRDFVKLRPHWYVRSAAYRSHAAVVQLWREAVKFVFRRSR
jgi:hypothetical protein